MISDPAVLFAEAARKECARVAAEVIQEIRDNPHTPYDAVHHDAGHPHLRDSFYVEETATGADVKSADGYWVYVEYGHRDVAWGHDEHRWIPAQPFVRPAVEIVRARNTS